MGDALKSYSEAYTIADWEKWNDPWELIYGFPYCMSPAPSFRHQHVNTLIILELGNQLRTCTKCKVIMPIDWQIDDETVVQPDISIICKTVTGKRLTFAPTAIFEILSPGTEKKDRTVKFELYQKQGVQYYVLVDAEKEATEVYLLNEAGKYEQISASDVISFDFEGCKAELDMSRVWGRNE